MPGVRLTLPERAQIEALFGQGLTIPQIAAAIDRHRSTVWRELNRNHSYKGAGVPDGARHPGRRHRPGGPGRGGAYRWKYSHRRAQQRADDRARRPRSGKLRPGYAQPYPPLWATVRGLLAQRWSPVQISRWLRTQFPDRPERWVSHETIYQTIYYQARGGMRQELARQVALRSGRRARRPQSRLAAAERAGRGSRPWLRDLHISTRPAEVADRAVPGHWEGDLLLGARGASAIITLVERKTRYVMLGALPASRVSAAVVDVLTGLMRACQAVCVS